MTTADWVPFNLPEAPTALGVVALVVVIGYLLLNGYSRTLRSEITDLRDALDRQSKQHRADMAHVNKKIEELEEENVRQRSMKHKVSGDLAKTVIALALVQRLARECTCNVLSPLKDIIERLLDELETSADRRYDDLPNT